MPPLVLTKLSESSNMRSGQGLPRHRLRDRMPGSPLRVPCHKCPSQGPKVQVSASAQNLTVKVLVTFKPSICFHGDMTALPRPSSVSFLNSTCAHTLTHTQTPNSTASPSGRDPRAQRHALSPWPKPLSPLQEKKKKKTLVEVIDEVRAGTCHSSLFKGVLERGPDSVRKTATVSWTLSKLLLLTVASFISGCAKCLEWCFSFSDHNNPLRKVWGSYYCQRTERKVEAQRGHVTCPRLQLSNGRAGTSSTC